MLFASKGCALAAAALVALATPGTFASADFDNAAILDAVVEDDACQAGDDAAECAVELRQLRAQAMQAVVTEHRAEAGVAKDVVEAGVMSADTHFGPDAKGRNLWTEPTWDAVLLEIAAAKADNGDCPTATGGTCGILNCDSSRGMTRCQDGKCVCQAGACAQHGVCFPANGQCLEDTGGTCNVVGCASSRGASTCSPLGKCLCKVGTCAWKGRCMPVTDTGGSCSMMSCASSRGPTTCDSGRCICKDGYVSVNGECKPFIAN